MSKKAQVSAKSIYLAAREQYDEYYKTPGLLRETDAFYNWVLDRLHATKGKLLDVASGEGAMVAWAQHRQLQGFGIDFSEIAIHTAARMSQGGTVLTGDGESLPFADNSFDFVTNLGSLEHYVDPGLGLREMKRVLRPSGRLGLLVPNSYYLLDIIWHVWRRGYPVSHSQTIERFASAGQWSDLLRENGLHIHEAHKYNLCFPKTLYDLQWYQRSPLKLTFPLTAPMTPFNLSYSFFFICSNTAT